MKKKTLAWIGVLVLVVLVGTALAIVRPNNLSYRGAAQYYSVMVGAIDADATIPVFVAPSPGRITRAWVTSVTGLTAADTIATLYRQWMLISKGTAGTGTDTLVTFSTLHNLTAYLTAGAFVAQNLGTVSTSKNFVEAGEEVNFRNEEETGTGCTSLGNTTVTVEFVPDGVNAPTGTPSGGSDQ